MLMSIDDVHIRPFHQNLYNGFEYMRISRKTHAIFTNLIESFIHEKGGKYNFSVSKKNREKKKERLFANKKNSARTAVPEL